MKRFFASNGNSQKKFEPQMGEEDKKSASFINDLPLGKQETA